MAQGQSNDLEFDYFRDKVLRLTGLDLAAYKNRQLERRLKSLLNRHQIPSLSAYARLLETSPTHLDEFKDFLTINVSEFYRNAEKFDELRDIYLKELLKERSSLRIWSAGASHGAEIYTVAMILEELSPGTKHYYLGTDIDTTSLKKAAQAEYLERDLRALPERYKKRWFHQVGEKYLLNREIVGRVTFKEHNLLQDAYPGEFDVILCRNVVIYFTAEVKERVFKGFNSSLRQNGILFIGSTESIFSPRNIGFQGVSPCFYRKL